MNAKRRLIIEPLGNRHDRAGFSCGLPQLDTYFSRQAGQDTRRRIAQVFVMVDEDLPARPLGFYTLSALSIGGQEFPKDIARKLPKHPIPAALIGRLAIVRTEQRSGLGASLIMDAVSRSLAASTEVAIFAIVVDAIDENAKAFYRNFGFRDLTAERRRKFLPLAPAKMS